MPTAPAVFPQTDAEKQAGMQTGRTLPEPELLSPRLDPALPHYVPARNIKYTASFKVGSSDVLPGLVERTLNGEFTKTKEIKQAVKNWRSDYLRV